MIRVIGLDRNPDILLYTEKLPDGRTAVRSKYDSPATCLRPVIQTEQDIYDDAAEAVAYCLILSDTVAFTAYAAQGQPFYDRLVRGIRAANITSYPVTT